MITNRQKQCAYLMNGKDPETIIKEEEKMQKEITMDYIKANEEERLTNSLDENASIIWIDETEEYAVIYWFDTWEGIDISETEYTGIEDIETIEDRLYNNGYMY